MHSFLSALALSLVLAACDGPSSIVEPHHDSGFPVATPDASEPDLPVIAVTLEWVAPAPVWEQPCGDRGEIMCSATEDVDVNRYEVIRRDYENLDCPIETNTGVATIDCTYRMPYAIFAASCQGGSQRIESWSPPPRADHDGGCAWNPRADEKMPGPMAPAPEQTWDAGS